MTLQEYCSNGGCEGCYFYGVIDVDGRKGCIFSWFDDESEDWEYSKNCDEISDLQPKQGASPVDEERQPSS